MPLKDKFRLPPGGWVYQEEKTGWPLPMKARDLPFVEAVKTILAYRENNWRFGLSVDFRDAARDLEQATCKRLPHLCIDDPQMIRAKLMREEKENTGGHCPGCGLKRKR